MIIYYALHVSDKKNCKTKIKRFQTNVFLYLKLMCAINAVGKFLVSFTELIDNSLN